MFERCSLQLADALATCIAVVDPIISMWFHETVSVFVVKPMFLVTCTVLVLTVVFFVAEIIIFFYQSQPSIYPVICSFSAGD